MCQATISSPPATTLHGRLNNLHGRKGPTLPRQKRHATPISRAGALAAPREERGSLHDMRIHDNIYMCYVRPLHREHYCCTVQKKREHTYLDAGAGE